VKIELQMYSFSLREKVPGGRMREGPSVRLKSIPSSAFGTFSRREKEQPDQFKLMPPTKHASRQQQLQRAFGALAAQARVLQAAP